MEDVKTTTISFPNLKNQPSKLFYMGDFQPSDINKCITVVGSRRMSDYGKIVIEKMIPGLVSAGKSIVSGLMYGVDQLVHRECLRCHGRTIAVIGWGIKWNGIAQEDLLLMKQILAAGGAIVSQWEYQKPMLWTFPARDKVMAGISQEIYVVEAAVKSGSMITVDWGVRMGKKIWAVPGPITSKISEGTNRLIADGIATMWLPEQQLNLETLVKSSSDIQVYRLLQNEMLTIDDIARKTGKGVKDVGAQLSLMVLEGYVVEREGKYYIKE